MEFRWSDADAAYRRELRQFLEATLPADWEERAKDGPGSDAVTRFSREFCPRLAERGWLTQSWPAEYGGAGASAWRHIILGEEMWSVGEPRSSQYMNVNWVGPDRIMPGTQSLLHRHEWIKHGTCYSDAAERYYRDSLALMKQLNASAVRALFADNIASTVTAAQVRERFDAAFGAGAGARVKLICQQDGGRRLITELQVHLQGRVTEVGGLGALLAADRKSARAAAPVWSTRSVCSKGLSAQTKVLGETPARGTPTPT